MKIANGNMNNPKESNAAELLAQIKKLAAEKQQSAPAEEQTREEANAAKAVTKAADLRSLRDMLEHNGLAEGESHSFKALKEAYTEEKIAESREISKLKRKAVESADENAVKKIIRSGVPVAEITL